MTLGERLGLSGPRERLLTRTLQSVLVGVGVYGLATGAVVMAATAGFALGVTLLPALLRREYGYSMDAGLVLWITVAVLLHVVGLLGPYDRYQWYDEVTHTVSATVVAGAGYAAFRALELHSDDVDVPAAFRGVFVVVFVLAAGVLWEVVEFALGGAITVYGVDDIATDMMFNAVGAVVVAVWGTDSVTRFAGFLRARVRSVDDTER